MSIPYTIPANLCPYFSALKLGGWTEGEDFLFRTDNYLEWDTVLGHATNLAKIVTPSEAKCLGAAPEVSAWLASSLIHISFPKFYTSDTQAALDYLLYEGRHVQESEACLPNTILTDRPEFRTIGVVRLALVFRGHDDGPWPRPDQDPEFIAHAIQKPNFFDILSVLRFRGDFRDLFNALLTAWLTWASESDTLYVGLGFGRAPSPLKWSCILSVARSVGTAQARRNAFVFLTFHEGTEPPFVPDQAFFESEKAPEYYRWRERPHILSNETLDVLWRGSSDRLRCAIIETSDEDLASNMILRVCPSIKEWTFRNDEERVHSASHDSPEVHQAKLHLTDFVIRNKVV